MGKIDSFRDESLRLVQNLRVNDGEKGGVVPDIVLDENYGLDAYHARIVVDIHLVLEVLDDADDEAEIPLPDEDAAEDRRVVVSDQIFQFPIIIGEQDDRDIETGFSRHLGKLQSRHVFDVERCDHQIKPVLFLRQRDRFLTAGDPGELRRVAEVETLILVSDELVETTVLFEEIEIIKARDE